MRAATTSEHEQGIATNQARAGGAPAARGAAPAAGARAADALQRPRRPRYRRRGSGSAKPGDTRDNPYLFLKSPSVIIGNNDPIVVPRGRVRSISSASSRP